MYECCVMVCTCTVCRLLIVWDDWWQRYVPVCCYQIITVCVLRRREVTPTVTEGGAVRGFHLFRLLLSLGLPVFTPGLLWLFVAAMELIPCHVWRALPSAAAASHSPSPRPYLRPALFICSGSVSLNIPSAQLTFSSSFIKCFHSAELRKQKSYSTKFSFLWIIHLYTMTPAAIH